MFMKIQVYVLLISVNLHAIAVASRSWVFSTSNENISNSTVRKIRKGEESDLQNIQ